MSNSETRTFLEDAFLRYDPDADLSEGGRAQTAFITPILNRIGTDPFDTDVQTFIIQRIQETHPNLAITELDALSDTLVDPMRILFEAIAREIRLIKLRASIENVESLSDQEVDALMSNFFETRQGGGFALGSVRAFFAQPIAISCTVANPASTRSGLRFFPPVPQAITPEQMLLNVSGSEFYFDINYRAQERGDEYNVDAGDVIAIAGFPTATRVANLRRFRGGVIREDSLDFVARTQESQSDRTLTVVRGIISEVTNNFTEVVQLQVIGYRDAEMDRDIVTGGGMGGVLDADSFGNAYGDDGVFNDDLDGDPTTQTFTSATGNFVSRIASVGSDPGEFYISLSYTTPTVTPVFITQDVRVLAVLSNTVVKLDAEFPLDTPVLSSIPWAIRKRQIAISDIPGGVTLPDTANGQLLIADNQVHIGGKTDVYLGGTIDEASAQITSLTDEDPLGRGFDAQTDGTNVIDLVGITSEAYAAIEVGMALVLEEGVDAEAYPIRQVGGALGNSVRVSVTMTGTQSNLSWRIVDEIDTELTEPKEIKVEGSDLVTAGGSPTVTTSGATNFIDANVQPQDVLRIDDDATGGDFIIETVGAVTLGVDPSPLRTASGLNYTIFRSSEGIETPVVRVSTIELLDSGNAPTGTEVPLRDPVLAVSRSFQNESSGLLYEGLASIGLVTSGYAGTVTVSFGVDDELKLQFFDADAVYAGSIITTTVTFTAGVRTPQQLVDDINANSVVQARGARASVLTSEGLSYVGIAGPDNIRVDATSSSSFYTGFSTDPTRLSTNSGVQLTLPGSLASPFQLRVRLGDVVEFVDGNNTGSARVIRAPDNDAPNTVYDTMVMGSGPYGPSGTDALYFNNPLLPDVLGRIRVGRPSVGSARVYFLGPTSAEFRFAETVFTAQVNNDSEILTYFPDPELQRVVLPAPPLTTLPATGTTSFGASITAFADAAVDFLAQQLVPGDILEVLYRPIFGQDPVGTAAGLPSGAGVFPLLAGETLVIRVGEDNPFITITFATGTLTREDIVAFINEQAGEDIATLGSGGELILVADSEITISEDSTILGLATPNNLYLTLAPRTNIHPDAGQYIIGSITDSDDLVLSLSTVFSGTAIVDTQYRFLRYVQRISSTEMNENQDETQLYYADIELLSTRPGDQHNIGSGVSLAVAGHAADGYRVTTANSVLSYSRAEIINAEFSRSILVVGSSDSPEEGVQLSKQNLQINYERSQTVDDVQSFADAESQRVVCEDILVRHLFPNFVSLNWAYAGGESEAGMVRQIQDLLNQTGPNSELEVGDFTNLLRRHGATSVYSPAPDLLSERTAPLLVVIYHDEDRKVRGVLVTDFIDTGNRMQRFLPGDILVNRVTSSAL